MSKILTRFELLDLELKALMAKTFDAEWYGGDFDLTCQKGRDAATAYAGARLALQLLVEKGF